MRIIEASLRNRANRVRVMNMDKISEKMRNLREENKLTQKELAARLYVTPSTVSKWENGVAVPDIYIVTRMADIFGVPVSELLE